MTDWREHVRARLPALPVRAEREREIVDELALQLEAVYQAALAAGSSEAEACHRAAAEVSDWAALAATLTQIERNQFSSTGAKPMNVVGMAAGFRQDLRLAGRSLLRTPVYTALAIVTLALGLGLGAAAFSLVDGVLVRPLPFPDAERLVLIKATVPPEGRETPELAYLDALDLRTADVFSDFSAAIPFAGITTSTDPPSRIEGLEVTGSIFSTLGVTASLGRTLTAADNEPASPPVVMIGYGFWQRLGAPVDVVGRVLPVDELPRTIVGVTPPGFRVDVLPMHADVFVPLTRAHPLAASRGIRTFRGIGRLAPGITLEIANATVATIGQRLSREYPDTNTGRTFIVHALQQEVVGPVRDQLVLVAGLVAVVLLVAAVNLAGLVLTRTVGQLRDLAVRLALGAARWRLVRESSYGVLRNAGARALATRGSD